MPRHQHRRLVAVAATMALAPAVAVIAAATATTVASAATAGCRVDYAIGSQWPGGFSAGVTVTNLGDQLNGWTLTWSFTNGQTITQGWNATVTQSGASVSAASLTYNATLATGASATFGFNGAWTGANPAPATFKLNGVTCTGAAGPTANPTGSTTANPTASATRSPTASATPTRSASPTPSRSVTPSSTGGTGPALKTVRVFWLKPTDVPFDQRYPDGITAVMREAQRYYQQELGRTFTLNTTVVEVVNGEHNAQWYITTNCNTSDHYWCVVENMQAELTRRFGIANQDSRWLCVGEISAEEAGKSGGGGGPGWVILSGHDADGAAGLNGPMNRWYGGMVHELGHGFGLPDASSTDGTPMSASFYNYPNTHFSQAQKTAILTGPYGTFLS